MGGLLKTWENLSITRRIVLALVVVATFGGLLALSDIARRPTMGLLYSGLEQGAAGDVVVQLEQLGVPTEVRGSAIYVPLDQRDRLRMDLAAKGLPSNGQQGYELLDELSGFGTTAEMFDAAYWRAREGELARTLLATPGIRQARVHLSVPVRRAFSRTTAKATASVTLTSSGGAVSKSSAMAARYLVALAVPGLDAREVVVIDSQNGVILRPGAEGISESVANNSERAKTLQAQIEELLSARVGSGRVRVSVNVETELTSESRTRRLIDPESKVLRESQVMEMAHTGEDSGGGGVTVASNLPDGEANQQGSSSSEREETRQTDHFDFSETREELIRPAGSIKRLSVAILLDGIRTVNEDGSVTRAPRPPEEIRRIETLVKSAIGYDEARGDVVTVESMEFADIGNEGSLATLDDAPSFVDQYLMEIIQVAVLALVILVLGLFVVRPVLSANRRALENADPASNAIDVTPERGVAGALPGPAGAGANAGAAANASGGGALPDFGGGAEGEDDFGEPGDFQIATTGVMMETPQDRLVEIVNARRDESIVVLKGWLEHDEQERAA